MQLRKVFNFNLMNKTALPKDVWGHIFSLLELNDILIVSQVCKFFYEISFPAVISANFSIWPKVQDDNFSSLCNKMLSLKVSSFNT